MIEKMSCTPVAVVTELHACGGRHERSHFGFFELLMFGKSSYPMAESLELQSEISTFEWGPLSFESSNGRKRASIASLPALSRALGHL